MIIKVSGMRDADNVRAVAALDIDMMAFDFRQSSPRFVRMISSRAGIIPDYSRSRLRRMSGKGTEEAGRQPKRVGMFADDMPQNIVTRVYNYQLHYVQLCGDESPVMISNLKRTLIPDIAPDIKVIKTITLHGAEDLERAKNYEGLADLLQFSLPDDIEKGLRLLDGYTCALPYIIGGAVNDGDAERLKAFASTHELCAGVDLDEGFETEPAVKDVARLEAFIRELKR